MNSLTTPGSILYVLGYEISSLPNTRTGFMHSKKGTLQSDLYLGHTKLIYVQRILLPKTILLAGGFLHKYKTIVLWVDIQKKTWVGGGVLIYF